MGIVDAVDGGIIVCSRGRKVLEGLVDLRHQAVFIFGADIEQFERLRAVFKQEHTGELRLADMLILDLDGLRKSLPFLDPERIIPLFSVVPLHRELDILAFDPLHISHFAVIPDTRLLFEDISGLIEGDMMDGQVAVLDIFGRNIIILALDIVPEL